jgi:hypothetical protein
MLQDFPPENSVVDPSRHMLSTQRHFWDEQERPAKRVLTFSEAARGYRRSLQESADLPQIDTVGLPSAVALAASSMLREFAARLRLDLSRSAISTDGDELAAAAEDVARILRCAGDLDR